MTAQDSKAMETKQTSKRLFVMWLITISLPVVFFGGLESGLRFLDYAGKSTLFIPARGEYADYYVCNPRVGRRYFFNEQFAPRPGIDLFLKEKPENGYRIFVLGGSTAAGYPYGANIRFSTILEERLRDVFPRKPIEVVNMAMTAVNTYTLLDFMDELLVMKPDLLLIYAGHNEFYGALGAASNESVGRTRWLVKVYLRLQRFKTFVLLRNTLGSVKSWLAGLFYGAADHSPTTLMQRLVGEQTIPYRSSLYEKGLEQFEGNLQDIFKKARKAGVRVVIGDLVSNVRHLRPFVSVAAGDFPAAGEVYQEARSYDENGEFDKAKETYCRAKDLDALRFRASEECNDIIYRVAAEFDAAVAPVKKHFEQHASEGIIGDELILDHLHPNVDGYFLMAEAFFETMREQSLIAPGWDARKIRPVEFYRRNWGFTALDETYADLAIKILKGGWPFQPAYAPNTVMSGYRPTTLVDSAAFEAILEEKLDLEHARTQLAETYVHRGDFGKAFEEYRALLHMTPYKVSPYLKTADMLIRLQKYASALQLLHTSLKVKKTPFALKWIGIIYLRTGRLQDATPLLEMAMKIAPRDPEVLYNLSQAYALNGQDDNARSISRRLEAIDPNFRGLAESSKDMANSK